MLNRLFHIVILLALAATASAQNPYLQGNLQGGPPAPGTKSRSPLNSMERAANNLAGATILTDTFGNQRFAEYVEINLVPINYLPTATGNTQNLSEFVVSSIDTGLYYIDWQGYAIKFDNGGGGLGVCDADWLTIGTAQCPLSINDSIFTYKYAAVGARLVWPTAEFLVNDSTGANVNVFSGSRNVRMVYYDNQAGNFSTLDQSGATTIWYIRPAGDWKITTAAGGTPENPSGPFVNQFGIDPNDTPLPTIQAYLYPNTRMDTNTVENFIYTDPVGKFRSRPIDSLVQIVVDSIQADSTLQRNWYTHNGVTTDLGRVAYIKRSAWWRILDSIGFIRFTNRPDLFDGPQFTIWQDSIEIDADTISWRSTYHPELQVHNLEAEGTYLYADSTKVVGIGQFLNFPSLSFDGTDRGFLNNFINKSWLINGDGVLGSLAYLSIAAEEMQDQVQYDFSGNDYAQLTRTASENAAQYYWEVQSDDSPFGRMLFNAISSIGENLFSVLQEQNDDNVRAGLYFGAANTSNFYEGDRAFGVKTTYQNVSFDWLQSYLPNDTTENAVSFYNRGYYFKNQHPIGAAGDTLFHFWAATGPGGEAGKDPGFMTLDQVCAHCSANAPNIYNSNGFTTDNTRIDTIKETITFLSMDGQSDGIYPFRFELKDGAPNEPEMMVWKFPGDSLTLFQSDQEIAFHSTNEFLLQADGFLVGIGDSVQLGHLATASGGDIVALAGSDGAPGNARTLKSLEGTFDADVLSYSAGSAGDRWDAVPANRSSIVVTAGTGTTTPGISVENILVDGAGGGTISLNYTPTMPGSTYTTVRYIYNEGGDAAVTVDTNQSWQFRNTTGDLGTSFSLNAGDNAKLVWIYNATASNARFFIILF